MISCWLIVSLSWSADWGTWQKVAAAKVGQKLNPPNASPTPIPRKEQTRFLNFCQASSHYASLSLLQNHASTRAHLTRDAATPLGVRGPSVRTPSVPTRSGSQWLVPSSGKTDSIHHHHPEGYNEGYNGVITRCWSNGAMTALQRVRRGWTPA